MSLVNIYNDDYDVKLIFVCKWFVFLKYFDFSIFGFIGLKVKVNFYYKMIFFFWSGV